MIFTAFESPDISIREAYRESRTRLSQYVKVANKAYLVLVTVSFLMLFTFLMIFNMAAIQEDSDGLKLIVLLLDVAVISLIIYGIHYFGKRAITLRRFAETNGFTFKPRLSIPKDSGELFNYGYFQISRNGVQGVHDGKHFMLFDYRYSKGSARYPAPQIFTVLLLNAGIQVDYAVFKNKNGHMKSVKFKQPIINDATPGVSESFIIHASEKDAEIIKKHLLQEDFLTEVLKASPRADIELKGGNMFIYMPGMLRDATSYGHLFKALENIKVKT